MCFCTEIYTGNIYNVNNFLCPFCEKRYMLLFSVQVFKVFNFMVIPCYRNTKHAKFTVYRSAFQFKLFSISLIGKTEISFSSLSPATDYQEINIVHGHQMSALTQSNSRSCDWGLIKPFEVNVPLFLFKNNGILKHSRFFSHFLSILSASLT